MVSVTGLEVEPEPPLPPPQAVASMAVTATPATSVHRLTALSLPLSLRPWSGPPDHWLDEPAVCRCGRPEEIQVAALWRLQHVIAVQGRPPAQVRRGGRLPRGLAAGQLGGGHLQ